MRCSERASSQQESKHIISNNHNRNRELKGMSFCHCTGALLAVASVMLVLPSWEGCSCEHAQSSNGSSQEDGQVIKHGILEQRPQKGALEYRSQPLSGKEKRVQQLERGHGKQVQGQRHLSHSVRAAHHQRVLQIRIFQSFTKQASGRKVPQRLAT